MLFLELFSGNADISKRLKELGHNCISVDYEPKYKADIIKDVYDLPIEFFKQFDCIWLSPDCTTYSLAQHGIHRIKHGIAISDYALKCDTNNQILINKLLLSGKPFIIENPKSHFRNRPFTKNLNRITVYYSTYGAKVTKPTDLFSNEDLKDLFNTNKIPGKISVQDIPSSQFLERCKIPGNLVNDIAIAMIKLGQKYETVNK